MTTLFFYSRCLGSEQLRRSPSKHHRRPRLRTSWREADDIFYYKFRPLGHLCPGTASRSTSIEDRHTPLDVLWIAPNPRLLWLIAYLWLACLLPLVVFWLKWSLQLSSHILYDRSRVLVQQLMTVKPSWCPDTEDESRSKHQKNATVHDPELIYFLCFHTFIQTLHVNFYYLLAFEGNCS